MDFFNKFEDEINSDFNWNSMDNFTMNSPVYTYETGNEFFDKFNNTKIGNVKSDNQIPLQLYSFSKYNKCDEKTAENKESSYSYNESDDKIEISSVDGEKNYMKSQYNLERNASYETQSTPMKPQKSSYESYFKLVEDKNKYNIGSEDDGLSVDNNNEIKTLSNILNNIETDLNNFIGDMLKFCPSDNLVKKQRIYKAKNIKRKRKSKAQVKKLEKEFQVNQNWEKDDFKRLSETLGLTRDQVYKWFWDQKNKKD